MIAAYALVQDANASGSRISSKAFGKYIGPPVVAIGGCVVAVGDRVTQGDDGGGIGLGSNTIPERPAHARFYSGRQRYSCI
jgi:hypothetical protein